jgi:peptide/nickel transport system substrate-binding protein
MRNVFSPRWLVVAVSTAMLLVLVAACGETIVVEKEVIKTIEVPGQTVTTEVIKEVRVPGETVTVTKEVIKEVRVPGETVTVVTEVVKEVQVPGQTVVVEKEVVKTVAGPERIVEKEVEVAGAQYTRNIWGEVVAKPQYGGSIPIAVEGDLKSWDPLDVLVGAGTSWTADLFFDMMGHLDRSIPRDEFDFTAGVASIDVVTGALAESWDMPDLETIIFTIREGVNFQKKGLPDGRELTAKDVEFNFHRLFGVGSGFTEPCINCNQEKSLPVTAVTSTDYGTVEVKASEFSFKTLDVLLFEGGSAFIVPPEVVKEYGDLKDWRNVVGTGPFMVTDFQPASVATLTRNPDYWGFDAVHPSNRLPYADQVKIHIIPDLAAKTAALRTGKITLFGGRGLPLDQILSLQKTNPELVATSVSGASVNMAFNLSRPPFEILDVRIAMQKALNLEEVARTFYFGLADPTPVGCCFVLPGQSIPYEQWPDETKWKYEYDPEAAEKLLDDAGFPRGSDGIRFKTTSTWIAGWGADMDAMLISRDYWKKIGVDVEIISQPDGDEAWTLQQALNYDMHQCGCRLKTLDPLSTLRGRFHSTKAWGTTNKLESVGNTESTYGVYDPIFDALVDEAELMTDRGGLNAKLAEMDLYYSDNVWALMWPPVVPGVMFNQPWIKGYTGEFGASEDSFTQAVNFAWVDQELKKEMGH